MIINIPITLTISMAVALFGSLIGKHYTNKSAQGLFPVFLYNAITGAVAAVMLLVLGGFGDISVFTLLLGLAFGFITALQGVFTLNALRIGPMSYTSVLINFSTLITALSGVMFFNESFFWLQGVGIVLMLASFVCSVEKKTDEKKASFKWLLYSIIALFCSAGIGIMQKIHQNSPHKGELSSFLIIAFLISFVCSLILAIYFQRKEKTSFRKAFGVVEKTESSKKQYVMLALVVFAGIFGAMNNKLNLYLSGVMNSAVFFPIVNGGGLVLSILAALVVFKEKLTKKQWLGIVLGVLSVLCLCFKL